MCGVAGYLNLDGRPASKHLLQEMTDAISHRGPDGEGHWVKGPVAVGHRRLAIIDPTPAGKQPMVSKDGRFVLSYNGEVYNFKDLRQELEAQGAHFASGTDTEVVLQALVFWGTAALSRLNGMFAFALWDNEERELLLGRDRYGIKPMYYAQQKSRFWFASEHKAFINDPYFARALNLPGLVEYMTFQNFLTDQTLLTDVMMLPAGHWMKVSIDGRSKKLEQYWDFQFAPPASPFKEEEYEAELDRLFEQAVQRQLVSDVEVGTYLSGGMDSGSITSIASKILPNLKSFTLGFDTTSASVRELMFDERAKARRMSGAFGTEHHELLLGPSDMESSLEDLVWALEEPRVGQSYPNYFAAKLASTHVKVVLSGVGGDELFGGYPWRYSLVAGCKNQDEFMDRSYAYWNRLFDQEEIGELFYPVKNQVDPKLTREIFEQVFIKSRFLPIGPERNLNQALYFEAKTFLHGLLVVEDKVSMAHSLETRVPFLDNDLVDFAMATPVAYKLTALSSESDSPKKQFSSALDPLPYSSKGGKSILRKVMSRHLPSGVAEDAKQGFSAPDASWFREESKRFVRGKLEGKGWKNQNVLSLNALRKLIEQHLEGRTNRRLLVWSFLNLESWFEQWLGFHRRAQP